MTTSSGRPARLKAYPGEVAALDDALDTLAGTIDDRLEAFAAGAGPYAPGFDATGTGEWIRAIATESRHLARWVASVGEGFEEAGTGTGLMTVDDSALSKLVGEPTTLEAEAARRGQDDAAALRDLMEANGIDPHDFDVDTLAQLDPSTPEYLELYELIKDVGDQMWQQDYAVGFYDQMNPDGMQALMGIVETMAAHQHYNPVFEVPLEEGGGMRVVEPPRLDDIQQALLEPLVHGWAIASGSVDLDEERRALLTPDDDINGDGRWQQHQLGMWISDEGRHYDPTFLAEAANVILVTQADTNFPNVGHGSTTDPGDLTYPAFGPGLDLWDDPELAYNELLALRALADNDAAAFEYLDLGGAEGRLDRIEALIRPDLSVVRDVRWDASYLDQEAVEELREAMERYGADAIHAGVVEAIQDDPLRYDTGLDIYADLVRAGGDGDVPDVTKRTLANAFALYMADIGAAADVARELPQGDDREGRDFNRPDLVAFFEELGYDAEAAAQLGESMSVWSAQASRPLLDGQPTEGDTENAYRDLTLVLAAMEDGFRATGDAKEEAHAGFIEGLQAGGGLITAVSIAAIPATGGASLLVAGARSLTGPLLTMAAEGIAGDAEGEPISPGALQRSVTQPLRASLAQMLWEQNNLDLPAADREPPLEPGDYADYLSEHFTHGDPVEYLDINSTVIAEQYEPDEHW